MSEAEKETQRFAGKWCFVSGPVTGIEERNKPAFDAVERWLLREGAKVVFNPVRAMSADKSWEDAMRICIRVLTENRYDWLVCLPGSLESSGSNLEQSIAEALDMKIVYLDQSAVDKLKAEVGV